MLTQTGVRLVITFRTGQMLPKVCKFVTSGEGILQGDHDNDNIYYIKHLSFTNTKYVIKFK